jgi:tRNA A-37 threonylcarbamoyl transferase component Bud32
MCYQPRMPSVARIGTEVAGYRVEALVARGGTSTVYRAEYPRLRIPVALKLLNEEVAGDEAFRERFVRESRLAAGINHPNIITIYDAGVWEDTLYIAMRLVGGGDLKDRLREGPLEPGRALSILAQVASGLDAAHAHGLVHRDVKPANIMVDSGPGEEAPEIAFVTDFGLIKHVQSGGRPTPTGEFLGTIDYVAPEQIEGRQADGRADVYSLGCVAFECLAGRPPFERENDAAILWAHMQEEPPALSSIRPDLPRPLDPVLKRALAKNPEARPETCGELVLALRDALGDDVARDATVALPVASTRGRGRRGLLTAAVVAAGLALGALGGALAVHLVDEDGPAGPARADPRTVMRTQVTTIERTVTDTEKGAYLRSLVPERFRRTCRLSTQITAEFWHTLTCRPRGGITLIHYSYAISGPDLTAHFRRRFVRVGVEAPGPGQRVPYVESCTEPNPVGLEEWNVDGRAGHRLMGRTELGDTDGRVLCVPGETRSRIEWTTPIAGVYAYAEAPNYTRLLNWWLENAGPIR